MNFTFFFFKIYYDFKIMFQDKKKNICFFKSRWKLWKSVTSIEILNMAKFWIKQVFENVSVTQPTEYARICLHRVLNVFWILNMPRFWIWKAYEYARVTKGPKYATIWLNIWLKQWLKNTNLVFYCKKTKSMLCSTHKMSQHHQP